MPEMHLNEFLFSCDNIYIHLKYSDRQKEETPSSFQLQGRLGGHTPSPALRLGTTQFGQHPHEGCWKKLVTGQFLNFLWNSVACALPSLCWLMKSHEWTNTLTLKSNKSSCGKVQAEHSGCFGVLSNPQHTHPLFPNNSLEPTNNFLSFIAWIA